MKNRLIFAAALLIILAAGILTTHFFQVDPADTAEVFLEQVVRQEFPSSADYLPEEKQFVLTELEAAYKRFASAYGLTEIEFRDFAPVSRSSKEAVFRFELTYHSSYFEPIQIESQVRLVRNRLFAAWEIDWQDNLPLPQYGTAASYSRTRQQPERGVITARDGQVLAGTGSLVAVGVQPDRITDPDLLLTTLEEHLGLSPDYVQRQYKAPGIQGHWFVPLVNLSEELYQKVDPLLRPIPGIFFQRQEARSYPGAFATAHLTGYLGEVTAPMLENYPELDYYVGEIVGRAGLEASKEDQLRGRPGYRFYVEPPDETRILLREKEVTAGENLNLTLDLKMQELAYEILQDVEGALVILDADSGAVLALASSPSYDPNEFTTGISARRWQELSEDPKEPMFNRALQGLYPPGSVFKVVTAAAALDQGLFTANSLFEDSGELRVEGNIIRNFQRQVFGEHSLADALIESINTTIAKVGLELGAELLQEYFTRFGLSQNPSLGLPASSGQAGSPGRSSVALAWSAIGQDRVLLTPLHVAQIFAVFANNGKLPVVHLVQRDNQAEASVVLQENTVEQINAMLKEVVERGTGQGARLNGIELFAKTGTAEVVGKESHAWFGGHVKLPEGPTLAFALLVEEGGVGGQGAAPLLKEYLLKLLN